jgi:hypothetical protein
MKKGVWTMQAIFVCLAISGLLASAALADPWKDESGKYRWKYHPGGYSEIDRDYKEEFWVGNCKIERKWEPAGSYKEERKCKGDWD